jgi:two-component system, sensor histidine kinase and response regulator
MECAGLTVDVAGDGVEAVEMAACTAYDLIMLSVGMSDMDGLEAARWIRTLPNGEALPILAIRGNPTADDRARCLDAGITDLVAKPIDAEALCASLLKYIVRSSNVAT